MTASEYDCIVVGAASAELPGHLPIPNPMRAIADDAFRGPAPMARRTTLDCSDTQHASGTCRMGAADDLRFRVRTRT
jgi:hypothetical protein